MARKLAYKPKRGDWVEVEAIELADGPGVLWQNMHTMERVTLREGVHPMENQNAITKISDAIQAVTDAQAGADDETLEETPEDRVVALFAEARNHEGRAQVIVSRLEQDGSRTHCRKYEPSEFENDNFDLVRQEFGPGNYWFLLYATNPESGKFVRRSGIKLKLAPLPASLAASQATNSQQSEIVRLLDRMDQRLAQVEKAPPPPDPMAQMTQFATVFKMVSEMMPKPVAAPPPPSMGEQVKEIASTLGLFKELREQIEPSAEQTDPLLALATPAMELIKSAMDNQRGNSSAMPIVSMPPQIASAPAANESPNPVAIPVGLTAGQSAPQPAPQTEEAIAFAKLNKLLDAFNTMAEIETDATMAAEIAYDKLPEEVIDHLLHNPNWWDLFSQTFPSVIPYRAWYESVRAEVVKIDQEPGDESPSTDPAPAPAPNNGSAGVHST